MIKLDNPTEASIQHIPDLFSSSTSPQIRKRIKLEGEIDSSETVQFVVFFRE